jgi:hypothetical protein
MSLPKSDAVPRPAEGFFLADGDLLEFPLLLLSWQAAALETAARERGLTSAQLVRDLIRTFLHHEPRAWITERA